MFNKLLNTSLMFIALMFGIMISWDGITWLMRQPDSFYNVVAIGCIILLIYVVATIVRWFIKKTFNVDIDANPSTNQAESQTTETKQTEKETQQGDSK